LAMTGDAVKNGAKTAGGGRIIHMVSHGVERPRDDL
jgi:hypothetical protein